MTAAFCLTFQAKGAFAADRGKTWENPNFIAVQSSPISCDSIGSTDHLMQLFMGKLHFLMVAMVCSEDHRMDPISSSRHRGQGCCYPRCPLNLPVSTCFIEQWQMCRKHWRAGSVGRGWQLFASPSTCTSDKQRLLASGNTSSEYQNPVQCEANKAQHFHEWALSDDSMSREEKTNTRANNFIHCHTFVLKAVWKLPWKDCNSVHCKRRNYVNASPCREHSSAQAQKAKQKKTKYV